VNYVTVLYPSRDDAKFDFEYYIKKHVPMVARLLANDIEICKGISSPMDAPPAFVCTARIRINSIEQFSAAMAQHRDMIMGDIPNYTNIDPIIQIDEVVT
jgi:uncharacterized protein (TIGR02118 family)